jgi:hypothetical protein
MPQFLQPAAAFIKARATFLRTIALSFPDPAGGTSAGGLFFEALPSLSQAKLRPQSREICAAVKRPKRCFPAIFKQLNYEYGTFVTSIDFAPVETHHVPPDSLWLISRS